MSPNSSTTLRAWLDQEPFALTLSSGFFGFFAHAGLISVLDEQGLYPSRLSGSSAGALVAALWASGRSTEALQEALFALKKEDFWDPAFGWGLLKGERFSKTLGELLPVDRFEDCRWPLAISVFSLRGFRTRVIESGPLNEAIRGSCAVPGLFHPVRVKGELTLDGGLLDRSGTTGVSNAPRVLYHHLSTRSKVRGRLKALSGIPRRSGLVPICIDGLPRVHPNALDRGVDAFHHARNSFLTLLDAPLPQS